MREVTLPQIVDALQGVGVKRGDGLLIHSALQFFGRPAGGIEIYLSALQEIMGEEGTIAVPTFNFSFANGEDYDPGTAPSVGMGSFSEYIRQHPDALRTTHPMQSFAVMGKWASELAACETPSAFDDGSAVDRMMELDFKLLLLGADIQASAIFHYSEQRAEVPYRFWKDFSGRIKRGEAWEQATYRMFVRDMEIDAQLVIHTIQDAMEQKGQWSSQKLNYGIISLCSLRDFAATADEFLAEDPWVFVTNLFEDIP
jgi:aminoglycoside 3-N-acetyltransferase